MTAVPPLGSNPDGGTSTSTLEVLTVEPIQLLEQIRRLAFGRLDDRDAMRRIRDLLRDYEESQPLM